MNSHGGTVATLTDLLRSKGNWSEIYVDDSVDTADTPQAVATRRESVVDRLRRAGSPQADLDAVLAFLEDATPAPSPACRYLLVKDGAVVVNEVFAGLPVEPELVAFSVMPDVVPLLKHQPEDLSYVVVETSRDGGEVRLYRAGAREALREERVQGRTDTLHKPQAGGWRHDRFQNHAEEIWRQNQSELAKRVDEVVRRFRPQLLVVAGDIRARQLLEGELSFESRAILSVQPTNTRAEGADDDALVDHISQEIDKLLARQKADILDSLEMHKGRGDNTVELSLGGVVRALASAQVDTLILDTGRVRDHDLLALDAEPWLATAPEEALSAGILGSVSAASAMCRAALLTDARVLFADSAAVDDPAAVVLPEGAGAAALLRWRTGPPVPGA